MNRTSIRIAAFSLLAAFLLAAPGARAQGSRKDDQVISSRGTPVANATVSICAQPANTNTQPCSPLATLSVDSAHQSYSIASSSGAVRSSGIVTITTTAPNSISPGETVAISGVTDPSFNGAFAVQSAGGNQFSYAQAGANATSGGGSVSAANPLTSDAFGNYFFYALPGKYTVQIYGPAVFGQIVQRDVLLACDPSNCTITGGTITGTVFDISQNALKTATNTAGHYPRNNGTQYVDTTIQAGDMPVFVASGGSHAPGAVPDPGSVAGALRFLREDATFQQAPQIVYSTVSASTNASISATTMATAGGSGNTYRVSWYFTNTALGTSCTGNSTVQFNLIWNDPSEGSAGTSGLQNAVAIGSGTANGVLGPIPTHPNYINFYNSLPFRAKANTAVQYSVTFVAGTGCSPAPSYQVYPILEQIQ